MMRGEAVSLAVPGFATGRDGGIQIRHWCFVRRTRPHVIGFGGDRADSLGWLMQSNQDYLDSAWIAFAQREAQNDANLYGMADRRRRAA